MFMVTVKTNMFRADGKKSFRLNLRAFANKHEITPFCHNFDSLNFYKVVYIHTLGEMDNFFMPHC